MELYEGDIEGKMTSAIEARHRLDKTLSSSALSDTAILSNLVRKQLHKTSAGSWLYTLSFSSCQCEFGMSAMVSFRAS